MAGLRSLVVITYALALLLEFCGGSGRSKRFLWITHDRRLIFPPGTILDLKPTLQVPFLRKEEPPDGIHSDFQLSWFFYIIFDELGLTHNSHPFPPFYPFGTLFGPSRKRSVDEVARKCDKDEESALFIPPQSNFPGGERAFIYPKLEQIISSFGWPGRPCLLRLVCETHEYPLYVGYGLLGELFTLFFTVSHSKLAKSHLPSYLEAESQGKAGNCSQYTSSCEKSLFRWEVKKITSQNSVQISSSEESKKKSYLGYNSVYM